MAPFDLNRLALPGEPVPIAEPIQTLLTPPVGIFSVSDTGVLAYQTGADTGGGSQLVSVDRTGTTLTSVGDRAAYRNLELSHDGKRALVGILEPAQTGVDQTQRKGDLWLVDLTRGLRSRFTFDGDTRGGIWSPDDTRIIVAKYRDGRNDLYLRASNGSGAEDALLADDRNKVPTDWSPDGRFFLYSSRESTTTDSDLMVLPLTGNRKPFPFMQTPFSESEGRFSPDGRWVAYVSNARDAKLGRDVASGPWNLQSRAY